MSGRPRPSGAHSSRAIRSAAFVAAGVFLSRLPLISSTSYGGDPDAWRVALAARHLATTGEYVASRFPSYPLHEVGSALIWTGGPWTLNTATALFSALAAGLLYLILRHLEVRFAGLGAFAFAFTPVVYENSLVTMDYLWSLAFILAALYGALRGKPVWAGLALGLAVGARLTAGVMVLPLLGLILAHREEIGSWQRAGTFVAAVTIGAFICYIPVVDVYGPSFLQFYEGTAPLSRALFRATVDVWGVLGFLGVLFSVIAILLSKSDASSSREKGSKVEVMLVLAIALYVGAYLRLPLEAGYLIPLVPLVLILLGLRAPPRVFALASACLLASPFVLDLESEQYVPDALRESMVPVELGTTRLALLLPGPLWVAQEREKQAQHDVDLITGYARDLPRPAIVLTDQPWTRVALTSGADLAEMLPAASVEALPQRFDVDPLAVLWPPLDTLRTWDVHLAPRRDGPE